MTPPTHRKYTFDTVFDGDGGMRQPPRPKRTFTPEEVEAARAESYRQGERSTVALAEVEAARALAEVANAITAALPALAQVAHDHRVGSAELSLACARKIAGAALDQFPEQPAMAALDALAREIEAQPRLTVRIPEQGAERLADALMRAVEAAGYPGQMAVKTDPSLPRAAFHFDWGDGRAAFDPDAALARVSEALTTALAAEGLHAEPLIPAEEA